MSMSDITQLRLQLLENGFSPICNRDKATYLKGWPSLEITPETIDKWGRRHKRDKATGLRVENGLAVIDIDIDDQELVDALANAILDLVPQLDDEASPLLVRRGGGVKEAWFVRTEEPFARLHTRSWVAPGESPDERTQRVEIFGGASARQFGAFGPHTVERDGTVTREYSWVDQTPADVTLSDLPSLSKDQFHAIVDAAERLLEEAGWEPVLRSNAGESEPHWAYDLDESMAFDCSDGVTRTLDELREAAKVEEGLRCSASWLEGPSARNVSRCLVSLTRGGFVAVWESAAGVTHAEKSAAPVDFGPEIDRIGEALRELKRLRRLKIKAGDDLPTAVAKMLELYAFCPYQQQDVVPLLATSPEDGKQMAKFRLEMLRNAVEEVGPRGGLRLINPVDVWLKHEQLTTVRGVRMRPDMPRPLFTDPDDGFQYVNCYTPPEHKVDGGDAGIGLEFIEHLVPDDAERDWFMRWLGFKLRFPHIPGPAVVMVAHKTFGTGRGALGVLLGKLVGGLYFRNIPFTSFTGKTYQSQYNEWQADALLVMVNESSETTDGSAFNTKRNTYEHLKEIVDPRPSMREVMVKGRANYRALSSTSFLIATNHADALPIPEHDRRFCVIQNGGTKPASWWAELSDWMERPENVAALFDHLVNYDLRGYSPFEPPPVFEGKRRMMDESMSDLDRAFEIVLSSLPSPFFVADQIVKQIRQVERTHDIVLPKGDIDGAVRKMVRQDTYRVGERQGRNWLPQIEGKRYSVYAKSREEAVLGTRADPSWLRDKVLQNGGPEWSGKVVPISLDRIK